MAGLLIAPVDRIIIKAGAERVSQEACDVLASVMVRAMLSTFLRGQCSSPSTKKKDSPQRRRETCSSGLRLGCT